MFDGKIVLITGGTGSFGKRFVKYLLDHSSPRKVIIFSRDEMKQWAMQQEYKADERVRFFIGDVRDLSRLKRAFTGVDYVVHAAATKIVPVAEYNPFECVKTNVSGAINVGVERVVALSTDKASSPINLYGATKLISDKLFVASSYSYAGNSDTILSVVRYGNVMGSRGSIIPFIMSNENMEEFPLTHPKMTRFCITLKEACELVYTAFNDMVGGEIYVKKIPSIYIKDLVEYMRPGIKQRIVGLRPGEKIHEQMIGEDDAAYTLEYDEYFKILPQIYDLYKDPNRIKTGKHLPEDFSYTSENNDLWLGKEEFTIWLNRSSEDFQF